MTVSCLGRSRERVKAFIRQAFSAYYAKEKEHFTFMVTATSGNWSTWLRKPRRSLGSVCLDDDKNERIIHDIKNYLDSKTALWYRQREIPYRRGYLFYGSPGCGKTSFALALAGHFELMIYIVPLMEAEIDDCKLSSLLRRIVVPSVLVLEDVDCAGMGRNRVKNDEVADGNQKPRSKSNVSLSGLLNAIDGMLSPEGHIVIMTTNDVEGLDEALKRPGRVDCMLEFSKASTEQVRAMFRKLYGQTLVSTEIHTLANDFAKRVPKGQLSPAQVQQFILMHANDPQGAVDGVEAWCTGLSQDSSTRLDQAVRNEDEYGEGAGGRDAVDGLDGVINAS